MDALPAVVRRRLQRFGRRHDGRLLPRVASLCLISQAEIMLPMQLVGVMVGLYGVGYLLTAWNPIENRNVLTLGFFSKLLGSILGVMYVVNGKLPVAFLPILFFADIIYLPPFLAIMRRLYGLSGANGNSAGVERTTGEFSRRIDGRSAALGVSLRCSVPQRSILPSRCRPRPGDRSDARPVRASTRARPRAACPVRHQPRKSGAECDVAGAAMAPPLCHASARLATTPDSEGAQLVRRADEHAIDGRHAAAHGVWREQLHQRVAMTTLILSSAPVRNSMASDNGSQRVRPNTIVATPNPATDKSIVRPARRIGGRCAMRTVMRTAPRAGAASIQPSPWGPTPSNLSEA